MPIDVTARHAFAFSGHQLQLADEHTMVFAAGNALAFTSTVSHSQHFLLRARPRQLVAFDCNWRTATIAVTVREPSAAIWLYSYPDKKLRGKLQHGARFAYSRIAFSRCGRRLVSLRAMDPDEPDESESSGAIGGSGGSKQRLAPPANTTTTATSSSKDVTGDSAAAAKRALLLAKRQRVCIWDVEQLAPVVGCASGTLSIDATFMSFDPSNADQFVVGGDDGLQVWKVFSSSSASLLRSVSVEYDDARASRDDTNETDDDAIDQFERDEKRTQWCAHAWLTNGRFIAANRAGDLVVVDAATARVVQTIDTAAQSPSPSPVAAIVVTTDTIVLSYGDGRVVWRSEATWDVLQTTSLHPASSSMLPSHPTDVVACMAPTPNHSKLYIGTRDGRIFELKSSVLVDDDDDDDDDGDGNTTAAMGSSPTDTNSSTAHLVTSCGSFPVGPVLASAALTPAGGTFPADALLASGGVSGRVSLWSLRTCRLVADASVTQLFARTPGASLTPSESSSSLVGSGATVSAASLAPSSTSQSTESLSVTNSESMPAAVITALAASAVDPVLMVGDHTGRLRAMCVAKVVGGSGVIELLPLHSVQLVGDGAALDTLEIHPTQPVVLAASTRAATVFVVSMDHEQHFPVLAYVSLAVPTERVVDVKWSVPPHTPNALAFTCVSSLGRFYVARNDSPASASTSGTSTTGGDTPPVELMATVVAVGDDVVAKCAALRFVAAAPTRMMLAVSPASNHVHVLTYAQPTAADPTATINVLSKALVSDAHDNGVATLALYPHALADGSELVATAGMNGAITLWVVAFGAGSTNTSSSSTDWQLEDVQAAKKKTVAVHAGAVTSLLFLRVGRSDSGTTADSSDADDVLLISTGADGCVFLLDVRIPLDLQSMTSSTAAHRPANALFISITSFAKYDDAYSPARERDCTPFVSALLAAQALDARNRFDSRKDATRAALKTLTQQLATLLADNNKLPEAEQLGRDEFVVNVDWRDAMRQQHRDRAERVRSSIQRDVAKMAIVRERMKREFWDNAAVHGVKLRGLGSASSSSLVVYNLPMRRLSANERRIGRKIELLRAIEYAHEQFEATELLSGDSCSDSASALMRFHDVLAPTTSCVTWLIGAGAHHPALLKELAATTPVGGASTNESSDGYSPLAPHALVYHPAAIRTQRQQRVQIHLLKALVRAVAVAFNSEFDALARLKETKIDEIAAKNARIIEICSELSAAAVAVTTSSVELFQPQLASDERAESILQVAPGEMTQSMYETDAMRRKRERDAAERLAIELQRQSDDVAGRALRDMMDGTLEVKKESLAAQALTKEPWMLTTAPDDMTPEQRKLVAQFEAAQRKLADEQETYRKSLELELKRLRSEIADISRAFDDKLRLLQDRSVATRRSVLVQQLYELRLAEDLLQYEQLVTARSQAEAAVSDLQVELQLREHECEHFSAQVERLRDAWHRAVDDDRSCDKSFSRDLDELVGSPLEPDVVKVLGELFHKRTGDDVSSAEAARRGVGGATTTKRGKSAQHLGLGTSTMALNTAGTGTSSNKQRLMLADGLGAGTSTRGLAPVTTLLQSLQHARSDSDERERNLDPFQSVVDVQPTPSTLRRLDSSSSRNSSSTSLTGTGTGNVTRERHVVPLDYDTDRPDGVLIEDRVWRALNALRTTKILAEHAAKDRADEYTCARSVADDLRAKLTALDVALQVCGHTLAVTTQALDAAADNAPLLVHIKQGQDESSSSNTMAPADLVTSHRTTTADALLVARASVDALNDVIERFGRDQVAILGKIRHFRKSINVMEWEHARLELETSDMDERYTDIQLLRVTKDLQELLQTGGDTTAKHARALAQLDAKLGHVGQHFAANSHKLEATTRTLVRQLRERQRENDGFERQAAQLAVQVTIRDDILASRKSAALRRAAAVGPGDRGSSGDKEVEKPQLRAIVVRRKLVDLAKAQTHEIELLRLELDTMRRRTFPSFVQHAAARVYQPADTK